MGKMVLILVIGSIVILGLLNYNINEKIYNSTQQAVDNYNYTQVRDICNSTAQVLIAELGDNPNLRISSPAAINLLNGSASYTISDTYMDSDSLIKLNITGKYDTAQKNTIVYLLKILINNGFIPASVLAAISTNNAVQTLGTMVVDGRNHDLNGNLVSGSGTLAVWTTNHYSQSGNSKLGATIKGVDYTPTKKNTSNLYAQNTPYPGGYPGTPDQVLGGTTGGYSDGTLKSIAVSGVQGSQYVTDPSKLKYPLSGVTYVELSSGGIWNPANVQGSGLLIVHNSSTNAAIKNINSGTFTGLIIADDMVHIQTTIIGAVICLTTNPSEGNCIGNGNGSILYSTIAVKKAVSDTQKTWTPGYGYASHRMAIKNWYE